MTYFPKCAKCRHSINSHDVNGSEKCKTCGCYIFEAYEDDYY